MVIEAALITAVSVSLVGLALSAMLELLMTPRPSMIRPWGAWALHIGLWLLAYVVLLLALGRPWFAMTAVSAVFLTLVLVNNAKMKSLREPFVFQDYEYFTDAIRHPRLYIPFLGWWKFLGATAGFVLAVSVGFLDEAVPVDRFSLSGQLGGILLLAGVGGMCLLLGWQKSLPVTLNPGQDLRALGFLASFFRYGQEEGVCPGAASPFASLESKDTADALPHLVAVQSESFFDPRPLYAGIKTDVLGEFDRLKADAIAHGKLAVPAWGANTVRTEFAFLSGIDSDLLGVHRFNPYRAIAAGWDIASVASFLKRLGYRTICIHPYPSSFYRRDRVYPKLGFDEFIDIRDFGDAMRFGPYIGDVAVAEKIEAILKEAAGPVFVFAITMENHGPLHLEKVTQADIADLYSEPPPAGCDDLTVYLRHVRNADRMALALRETLEKIDRPAGLCWFGDHVPIMPEVYENFGTPDGEVEYVFWSNRNARLPTKNDLDASNLSVGWMRAMNLA